MTRKKNRCPLPILGITLGAMLSGASVCAAEAVPATTDDEEMQTFTLDEIVVTGYRTSAPLALVTDPQQREIHIAAPTDAAWRQVQAALFPEYAAQE